MWVNLIPHRSKRKSAAIILLIGLVLVTADSLVTNYMISRMLPEYLPTAELNPLMASLAGTPWLFVVKDGWVLIFLVLVLVVKDRKLSFGKGLLRRRLTYKTAEGPPNLSAYNWSNEVN